MRQFFLLLMGSIFSIAVSAQQQPPQPQRPLPNQFRDFVDHQQKWEMERPKIEKKDGKVIITMSEQQFKRMQMMRKAQQFRMARFNQQSCCEKCEMKRPMIHRGPIHQKF